MFKDRKDAALQLAKALEQYRDTGAIVLGVPRGGAETAYYVAMKLNADFSLVVSRKLGHPHNPEFAFGALAEDGSAYLNQSAAQDLSQEDINRVVEDQNKVIRQRVQILRKGKPLPDLENKVVIIVDDGIATGATLFAAIQLCRNQKAAKIVVAAPVSGKQARQSLMEKADEVVILKTPPGFYAVSLAYESFFNLTDQQALDFLNRWEQERNGINEKRQ